MCFILYIVYIHNFILLLTLKEEKEGNLEKEDLRSG